MVGRLGAAGLLSIGVAACGGAPTQPLAAPVDADAVPGEIEIVINGLRQDAGPVLVAIFANEDAFPEEEEGAFKSLSFPVHNGTATYTLGDVPPGVYALAWIHDEDGDDELDKSFIGIPEEAVGASNDSVGAFSAPSWEDARFLVEGGKTTRVVMKPRYF